MEKIKFVLTVFLFVSIISVKTFSQSSGDKQSSFSFVFCTDIHVQPERRAVEGFTQAIDTINKLQPAFVVTGGTIQKTPNTIQYNAGQ